MKDSARRESFALVVEVVSSDLGVFVKTTRDGVESVNAAGLAADVALAMPALLRAALGAVTEIPDA